MAHFILDIETNAKEKTAALRLSDQAGIHLGSSNLRLFDHPPSKWEGVFNAHKYVNLYKGEERTAEEIVAEIGAFLGKVVLGPEIMGQLSKDEIRRRSLFIRLPVDTGNPLDAAFARVPWEMARSPHPKEKTLAETNVMVRAVLKDDGLDSNPVPDPDFGPGDSLRVLLVFAEVPGSKPLAMRLERERLLELFYDEIMPLHKVEVDVLCHGVTDSLLRDQVRKARGYHVIHWSGHGHLNLLELQREEGGKNHITGRELVDLFREGGGFIPHLFFLSACHSGVMIEDLRAALGEKKEKVSKDLDMDQTLGDRPGFTGTALELLKAGVPQVAAMRYPVGDAYARRLARRFYRSLLAEGHPAEDALGLARSALIQDKKHSQEYFATDHATPMIYGRRTLRFQPPKGRSPGMDRRRPEPHPILSHDNRDLDVPQGFVGRNKELAQLHKEWIMEKNTQLAVIQGLAGMGKTALAAESIHLWHGRFQWVLAFQSRGYPLAAEEFYIRLDQKLAMVSEVYRDKCEKNPYNAIHIKPDSRLTGEDRYQKMRDNLCSALFDEPILLVLDNFETNLWEKEKGYSCKDPEWDRILTALASRAQDASRVLITTRHLPAALRNSSLHLALGPLSTEELALFVWNRKELRDLLFGAKEEEKELAGRALRVSRGHPLILQRLADLARNPKLLAEALDQIQGEGYRSLPDIMKRTGGVKEEERKYIEDVMVGAVDWLIEREPVEARRLLWMITLALEPVTEGMAEGVWGGESVETERFREFKEILNSLCESGLLHREGEKDTPAFGFHEVVRERIGEWMENHPDQKGQREQKDIWVVYGERYEMAFEFLKSSGKEGSRDQAAEAGRRALSYFVKAGALERLGSFASELVTGTSDPRLLKAVIAELEGAAATLPAGETRWRVRTSLADAFRRSDQPERALPLYELAAAEAEEAGNWPDVGCICHNWANALVNLGKLDLARELYMRSIEAKKRAGSTKIDIVRSEVSALRIDVMQGKAKEVWPEIASRLKELREWRRKSIKGEDVHEATDREDLLRALVSALDIAEDVNRAMENWEACLDLLVETEEIKAQSGAGDFDLAIIRFNRYGPLIGLNLLDEAKMVMEGCLKVFRRQEDIAGQARALSALADIWGRKGDPTQAEALERQALALENRLDNPTDRAISHGNLADYLEGNGNDIESTRHQVAILVYYMVCGHEQSIQTPLKNYAVRLRRAASQGKDYPLPRLSQLLALPEFSPLARFLENRGEDLAALQEQIDQMLEQVRKMALGG